MEQSTYPCAVETKTVSHQGRPITLTNRTPVLTSEQREKQRLEIERRLYDVVSKYRESA